MFKRDLLRNCTVALRKIKSLEPLLHIFFKGKNPNNEYKCIIIFFKKIVLLKAISTILKNKIERGNVNAYTFLIERKNHHKSH